MHQFHKFILSWNSTFRTVRLVIIRSLFTVHSAVLYVIQVCRQLSSRTRMELQFHPGPTRKLINSWWWTDELSETCWVSWQNTFVKLVHLVGFITKKFVGSYYISMVIVFRAVTPCCLVDTYECLRRTWLLLLHQSPVHFRWMKSVTLKRCYSCTEPRGATCDPEDQLPEISYCRSLFGVKTDTLYPCRPRNLLKWENVLQLYAWQRQYRTPK
jgi:hypothetical protein